MPSECIVPVVTVGNIREHPGADMLSIVEVLGYQMVTGLVEDPEGQIVRYFAKDERDERGRRVPYGGTDATDSSRTEIVRYSFRYKEGDKAVYFPADTLIPDEWAEEFDVKHLLRGAEKNRVGRQRLRGEPSFGLVVEPADPTWEVGKNVRDHYGASKYEPPIRAVAEDVAEYDNDIDPYFIEYTDLQNGKLLYEKFQDGEQVIACEKIHGSNSRVGYIREEFAAGSRTTRKKHTDNYETSLYWYPFSVPGVQEMLEFLGSNHQDVILFGEVFGGSVQSLNYGIQKGKGWGYRAFDLYIDGKFLSQDMFETYCQQFEIPIAPVLYRGPFDLDKINGIADGRTTLEGDHIREGVVVRPVVERRDPALGRLVLKFIGSEYELSKHKKKDTTDV